ERLRKGWTSPVYAFFEPTPSIEYTNGRRSHVFKCMGKSCNQCVRHYLDKGDAKSTSNMAKHVKRCWGEIAYEAAQEAKTAASARESIVGSILTTGSITSLFERKGKGKVTYSHRQHTKSETKAEIVRWVSESLRPFEVVNDRGFKSLMKTGQPEYYLPSPSTVSRDVKLVFANVRKRIARMLRDYDGDLNFATDVWTSPNHKAFVAVSVHLEHEGQPLAMLLDIVEVAKVCIANKHEQALIILLVTFRHESRASIHEDT
ncbi:hypothetical protein DFH29DRAFT_810877, partial [Suillus ampliporus]